MVSKLYTLGSRDTNDTGPLFNNLHDDPRWTEWLAREGWSDEDVAALAAIPFEVRLPR